MSTTCDIYFQSLFIVTHAVIGRCENSTNSPVMTAKLSRQRRCRLIMPRGAERLKSSPALNNTAGFFFPSGEDRFFTWRALTCATLEAAQETSLSHLGVYSSARRLRGFCGDTVSASQMLSPQPKVFCRRSAPSPACWVRVRVRVLFAFCHLSLDLEGGGGGVGGRIQK